jgi:hypothetical protein
MIQYLIARFGLSVFKYAAIVFAVVASITAFAFNQQSKGAAKAVAKIEKATTNVISKGNAAVSRSAPGAPGRLLDPSTRTD